MNHLWTSDVLKLYDALGGQMRLVGGCVRDYILGMNPKDVDIATPVLPTDVLALLKKNGIRCRLMSESHGIVTACIGEKKYEIATLRQDKITNGSHAVVSFIDDYQADSERRDLTINAMSMDRNGTVYDYWNGQADLKNKQVRFIGDPEKRITEDYLRIYRYFRFWARFGAESPDEKITDLCYKHKEGLKKISYHRRETEVKKILMSAEAQKIIYWLLKLDLFCWMNPPLTLENFHKSGQNYADVFAKHLFGRQKRIKKN